MSPCAYKSVRAYKSVWAYKSVSRWAPFLMSGLLLSGCKTRLLGEDAPPFAQSCQDPWPLVGHDAQHSGRGCTAGPAGPDIQWVSETAPGAFSSPVVGGNRLVYAVNNPGGEGAGWLYAFSPADGSVVWRSELGPSPTTLFDIGAAIGPGGPVYAIFQQGGVRAFDGDTGAVRWTVRLCDFIDPWLTVGPDGTIYAACSIGGVHALRPEDGSTRWSSGGLDASILALGRDGGLLVGTDTAVASLDVAAGSLRWRNLGFTSAGNVGSVGVDGALYVFDFSQLNALRPSDGRVRWQRLLNAGYEYAPPAAADGTLYVNNPVGLEALRPDGTTRWILNDGVRFNGAGRLVDGAGTIYTFAFQQPDPSSPETDFLYAVAPDGKVLWKREIGAANLRNPPALGPDGIIYIGGSLPARIYAFGR